MFWSSEDDNPGKVHRLRAPVLQGQRKDVGRIVKAEIGDRLVIGIVKIGRKIDRAAVLQGQGVADQRNRLVVRTHQKLERSIVSLVPFSIPMVKCRCPKGRSC